ncbi:hypothetical protein HRbin08_01963 [bacterium HR08]|nr:hypothetical protein HRbin08_01963 [bacterium HR08]
MELLIRLLLPRHRRHQPGDLRRDLGQYDDPLSRGPRHRTPEDEEARILRGGQRGLHWTARARRLDRRRPCFLDRGRNPDIRLLPNPQARGLHQRDPLHLGMPHLDRKLSLPPLHPMRELLDHRPQVGDFILPIGLRELLRLPNDVPIGLAEPLLQRPIDDEIGEHGQEHERQDRDEDEMAHKPCLQMRAEPTRPPLPPQAQEIARQNEGEHGEGDEVEGRQQIEHERLVGAHHIRRGDPQNPQ